MTYIEDFRRITDELWRLRREIRDEADTRMGDADRLAKGLLFSKLVECECKKEKAK